MSTLADVRATQSVRGKRGVCSALVTHCPAGHERTPENTYTYVRRKTGFLNIKCKACAKANVVRARAAGYIRKDK